MSRDGDMMVWAMVVGPIEAKTLDAFGVKTSKHPGAPLTWIPHSQCDRICWEIGGDMENEYEIHKGDMVLGVRIPQWLAEKKRLDYE